MAAFYRENVTETSLFPAASRDEKRSDDESSSSAVVDAKNESEDKRGEPSLAPPSAFQIAVAIAQAAEAKEGETGSKFRLLGDLPGLLSHHSQTRAQDIKIALKLELPTNEKSFAALSSAAAGKSSATSKTKESKDAPGQSSIPKVYPHFLDYLYHK